MFRSISISYERQTGLSTFAVLCSIWPTFRKKNNSSSSGDNHIWKHFSRRIWFHILGRYFYTRNTTRNIENLFMLQIYTGTMGWCVDSTKICYVRNCVLRKLKKIHYFKKSFSIHTCQLIIHFFLNMLLVWMIVQYSK